MTYQDLLSQVRAKLKIEGWGSQKQLANDLGVSAQRLNNWINKNKRKPGAELLLKLQEWVKK